MAFEQFGSAFDTNSFYLQTFVGMDRSANWSTASAQWSWATSSESYL